MFTLSPLYNFVARAIVVLRGGLKQVVGDNGWAWALAIVVLVAAVRLILVPLFVKQIKTQRTMQVMQPKIKELREKHKNDKQKMNEEMIKLQREHGNPLLGCLPMVLQIPLFLALYRVMNGFSPKTSGLTPMQLQEQMTHGGYYPTHLNGLSVDQADQIAHAKIFGASLATSLLSPKKVLDLVGGDVVGTKVVSIALILIMVVTIYITQRQIMGRNGAPTDPTQATTQKLLLYASPLFLGVFGLHTSIGGLLYWFTTNIWSMGQQFLVIRRMPPMIPDAGSGAAGSPGGTRPGGPAAGPNNGPTKTKTSLRKQPAALPPDPVPSQRLVQQRVTDGAGGARPPKGPTGANRGGSSSKRRKSRRGGRH